MEDPTSKLYTGFAFVSAATVVLTMLYRKKQTHTVYNTKRWEEFWKYIFSQKTHQWEEAEQSLNFMLYTDDTQTTHRHEYTHSHPLHEHSSFTLTHTLSFKQVAPYMHLTQPSHTVDHFLSELLNNYFTHRLTKFDMFDPASLDRLHTHLTEQPLQILVPLCGASYDLLHIASVLQTQYRLKPTQFRIMGIDSSSTAITQFYKINGMVYVIHKYNPKYYSHPDFYRVAVYSNKVRSIDIVENDVFRYYQFQLHLNKDIQISPPCLIKQHSVDLVIDVGSLSCIDPSDRYLYMDAIKYWLKPQGLWLLNTYCYDPKYSNSPPYTVQPAQLHRWFGDQKYKLLEAKPFAGHADKDCVSHSWLVQP